MAFHVYENWQAGPRKSVIHEGSCGFCKDGQGRAGGYDPAHAQWHGPFDDLTAARKDDPRLKATDPSGRAIEQESIWRSRQAFHAGRQ
jgi:hypothetical protein